MTQLEAESSRAMLNRRAEQIAPSAVTPNAQARSRACDDCISDPETGVVLGLTQDRNMRSRYRCSMCPAIHTNSRSWLRSSSTQVPSDPPFRAVFSFFSPLEDEMHSTFETVVEKKTEQKTS